MLPRLTILFLLLLTLPACNIRHRGIEERNKWGPSTFLEDGALVTLYTAQCSDYQGPTYWYIARLETFSNILTEEERHYDHADAKRLFYTAPPWRREEVLYEVTERLAFDIPPEYQRILISSHNPTVIAIAATLDPDFPSPHIKFSIANFQRPQPIPVNKLLILRAWPNPDRHLSPLHNREVLELNPTQTPHSIFLSRPWVRSSAPFGVPPSGGS